MNKKLIISTYIALFFSPLITHALNSNPTTTTKNKQEEYALCKKNALLRREQTMRPALKEYVTDSQAITDKAKRDFTKVSWYIDTSYRAHAREIQDEKRQAMVPVAAKIMQIRNIANNTWKAEDALCELNYNNGSTTLLKNKK